MTIFTAMRCTTLVKLPVALSGGNKREFGSRCRRECQHVSTKRMSGKGIDGNFRLLPDGHMGQLRFLVVGNHPDVRQRGECRDLTAHTHQLSGLDLALTDHPVLSRSDGGVPEIDVGGIECGALRGDRRLALCELCLEDRELPLGSTCLRTVLRELRLELSAGSPKLLARLDRRGTGIEKTALPRQVAAVLLERCAGGGDHRTRRLDIRELQRMLRLQYLSLRRRGRNPGCRLRHGGTIVIVDQLREHLPLLNPLKILDRKFAHVARHLRGYGGEIAFEVGIVRLLPPAPPSHRVQFVDTTMMMPTATTNTRIRHPNSNTLFQSIFGLFMTSLWILVSIRIV